MLLKTQSQLTLILSMICSVYCKSKACETFEENTIFAVDHRGHVMNRTIDGCIEYSDFIGYHIVQVTVKHQYLDTLGRECVRDMPFLKRLIFQHCEITKIDSKFLSNLPKLEYLEIFGGELDTLKKNLFDEVPEITTISVHDTLLCDIRNEALGYMPSLKRVSLYRNHLEFINKDWFTGSENIQIMDISFNKITTISRNTFRYLKNLRELYLDFNNLELLETAAFNGLQNLRFLGLRYNKLKTLDADVFPTTTKIGRLDIGANSLNYLSPELRKILEVGSIVLDANPWMCYCYFQITEWLNSTNARLEPSRYCPDIPFCYSTSSNVTDCAESDGEEVSRGYFVALRTLGTINPYCARES
ncbi:leucine-rich repeat-containing protein egg-6-like [Aethina tumida]|uniref:leucine-rich repeat-containing protein egg-6-like n=1 Tax=Aethina tumida TaxID=116153 RepID=UPI002147F96A|nr:leucine-rich repeat-containing protein egg-6-like [Aethina tumida]